MSVGIRQLFNRAVHSAQRNNRIRGRLGRKNEDNSYSMAVFDRAGFVYVTLTGEGSQTIDIAFISTVPRLVNLPVVMERIGGNLVVTGLDYEGGSLSSFLNGGNLDSSVKQEFDSFWFKPGRVLWSGSGVTVRIRPFFYRYNGANVYYAGNTLSLTANLPATSAKWAWVIVGVDPATNLASAVTGAEFNSQVDLVDSLIDDIVIGDLIPLGAVQCSNGDTVLSNINRYRDARHWLDERLRVDDLTDVALTAPADGHVLTYDTTTSKWINEASPSIDVAAQIHAAADKPTPVDADEFGIADSAALWVLKRLTWANIKVTLQAFFDTLYSAIGHSHSPYVHPNHTGEVTSVGDGATTIANNVVTFAKMQQIQTQMLLGRNTAATGNVEELSGLPSTIDALYFLLSGRVAGQTAYGGTGWSESLILHGSLHATKGPVLINPTSGGAGIGTATPFAGSALHVFGANNPVLFLERSVSGLVSSILASFTLMATTTGDMANGFGTAVDFHVNDSAVSGLNPIARIAGRRSNGSDTTGDIVLMPGVAGTLTELMRLSYDGALTIRPGTASALEAKVGGVLFVSTTDTGNVGTGEDNLLTYSVPANTLANNGDSIWFEASGNFANNGNNKTVRAHFGTAGVSLLFDSGALTLGSFDQWVLRGRIYRTGATAQKGFVSGIFGTTNLEANTNATNQTLSGAVTLRITGEATSNNDIVCQSLIVGWSPANT